MNAKDAKKVIAAEIKWCKANPGSSRKGQNFEEGFIRGLQQAKTLISKLAKDPK